MFIVYKILKGLLKKKLIISPLTLHSLRPEVTNVKNLMLIAAHLVKNILNMRTSQRAKESPGQHKHSK